MLGEYPSDNQPPQVNPDLEKADDVLVQLPGYVSHPYVLFPGQIGEYSLQPRVRKKGKPNPSPHRSKQM